MARFIFVTGGVVSSLGKGLLSASLGALLQARGFKVRIRKFDPYLNVDPGTMSPYQHGEVYRSSRTMSPPGVSTATSSPRSGAAIISGRPSR